ncbi:MAG: hypothetical protein HC783_00605 [Rhodobacteraceae bacterium]|nr:hypothetical protein [Paracoccaceae bacterium]
MSPVQLIAYLGPAALISAGIAAFLWLGLRLPFGLRPRHALTLFLVCFFLTLTQYPLPDRAALDCSAGGVAPILRPFETFAHIQRMLAWEGNDPAAVTWRSWVGSKVLQAAVMNLLLCAAIGAAFAWQGKAGWRSALGLAVVLSGGAEMAQLTGLFGLYPCAFRTFEVDDLIFNIGGLMAGFTLLRWWQAA